MGGSLGQPVMYYIYYCRRAKAGTGRIAHEVVLSHTGDGVLFEPGYTNPKRKRETIAIHPCLRFGLVCYEAYYQLEKLLISRNRRRIATFVFGVASVAADVGEGDFVIGKQFV